MLLSKDHPLVIPEIVLLVSRFVAPKDAIACAQVCKAWSDPFTSIIWHTIDFNIRDSFVRRDSEAIERHGHRIRVVIGIEEEIQLMALHHQSVCKLKSLAILMTGSFQFQTYCGDLLRQNAATIVHLDLMPRARPRTILFPFDALYPLAGNQTTSNLSLLKIGGMVLTRDGFSSLLRTCPALKALHLERSIIYTSSCSDPYQHTGLTELVAPLEQIYGADPVTTLAPWILEHFPQLEVLYTWTMKPTMEVTASEMKAQFTRCCPHLKGIGIDSTALITSELLTAVFHSLTTIVVSNFSISTGVMDAILSHQGTLIRFSTSLQSIEYYDQEDTAEYGDGVLVSGEIIQLIPATCARLTKLELPSWVMDMTEIEEAKWSCTELEELYVRVRELDTKEKIDCAIGMWIGYRNSKNTKGRGDPGSSVDQSSDCHENSTAETAREEEPIEARVARHLSCFGKLRKVWLGPKTQLVRV